MISWVFPSKFQHICITSVSGRCAHFTFKVCQIVAGKKHKPSISRIFQSNFWRVFDVWPNCAMWRLGFVFFNIGRTWVRSVAGRQLSLCFRKQIRTAFEVRFWWHRWGIPVGVGWKIELARWWQRSWLKVTPWYPDRTEDGGKSENEKKIMLDVNNKKDKFE